MSDYKIGVVESRFADIVWNHAPLSTKELIELCNDEREKQHLLAQRMYEIILKKFKILQKLQKSYSLKYPK